MLVHRRRCSPEAGSAPVLSGTLFSVLLRLANPNEFLQKLDLFDEKGEARSVVFLYKSGAKSTSQEGLAKLKAVVSRRPVGARSFFLMLRKQGILPEYRLDLKQTERL